MRTVKLKDFPWNGWLRVAMPTRPAAAWNPVAGFTDESGAFLWSVLGDAAVLPEPYGVGWLPNRVHAVGFPAPWRSRATRWCSSLDGRRAPRRDRIDGSAARHGIASRSRSSTTRRR